MKQILLFISLSLIIVSCNSNEQITENHQLEHEDENEDTLLLNDGEKWKVVDHMMSELRQIEEIVIASNAIESTLVIDDIADSLIVHLDLLTSNCTMQGQAHDELHKWLVPFINLVNEFAKNEDEAIAKEQLEEMKHSFEEFNTYFE